MGTSAVCADELTSLDLRDIKVGGEIGRRIDITIDNNLLALDMEQDFLDPFRRREDTGGYVGLGKLIDALVRFAVYSGDARVLERKQRAVSAIIATQEPDGYLGMFEPDHRLWSLWDIHEMAYLIYGLVMDHRYFGETASLDAARKAADYIIAGWSADPGRKPADGAITVYMAVTNLENALLALHTATGDTRYLDFCTGQRALADWDAPVVLGRWGTIQGHVYAYLCRCIAQLRLHRLQPDPKLLVNSRRALDFMFQQDGLVITGTAGQHECWHDTQEGAGNLGETCATAYLIRFLDELMRLEPDPRYGDLMERAIHNALFAAQSPDGRRIRYYAPFEGPRVYFDKDTYCCPCNYRRILAELPAMIVYRGKDGLTVNLYTPSTVRAQVADGVGVSLTQDTRYPNDGHVAVTVDPEKPIAFALRLRIPAWCPDATIRINSAPADGPIIPGGFHTIQRQWQPGDRVELDLPMPLRLIKGRNAQAGRAAIMRGPLVFTLDPANDPALKGEDLRLITIDPATLDGPHPGDAIYPGGQTCTIRAWRTTNWYPAAPHDWTLTLTPFPDPNAQATYFHLPNPNDPQLVEDELAQ
ncbi:MAG: hypothetical protein GWP08_05475 [Nitrospiraceae bacterium]|nr:hypothetical protein [Nitrospiraceae bacterium]